MKKLLILLVVSLFITTNLFAKTLEERKAELQKVYEAGGISKVEYKKAIEFLENPEEKKKKSLSLAKKKEVKNPFKKKEDDKEEITLEKITDLGEPIQYGTNFFPESMVKEFKGCNNSFKCKGKKAGAFLFKAFNQEKKYQQKNPGELIKAMAMYEVFYASQLWNARTSIERYKADNYKNIMILKKKDDEKKIRSLFGMSKGQVSMREALGMNSETAAKDAIKNFWLLGDFLELGTAVKHEKLSADIKKRQNLLQEYKRQISSLKKKLQDDLEEDNEESIE